MAQRAQQAPPGRCTVFTTRINGCTVTSASRSYLPLLPSPAAGWGPLYGELCRLRGYRLLQQYSLSPLPAAAAADIASILDTLLLAAAAGPAAVQQAGSSICWRSSCWEVLFELAAPAGPVQQPVEAFTRAFVARLPAILRVRDLHRCISRVITQLLQGDDQQRAASTLEALQAYLTAAPLPLLPLLARLTLDGRPEGETLLASEPLVAAITARLVSPATPQQARDCAACILVGGAGKLVISPAYVVCTHEAGAAVRQLTSRLLQEAAGGGDSAERANTALLLLRLSVLPHAAMAMGEARTLAALAGAYNDASSSARELLVFLAKRFPTQLAASRAQGQLTDAALDRLRGAGVVLAR